MRIGKRYVALFLAGVMTATAVSVQGGVAEGSTIETECSQVSENKAEDTENLQDGVYRVTFDGSNTRKEIQSALNLIRSCSVISNSSFGGFQFSLISKCGVSACFHVPPHMILSSAAIFPHLW